MKLYKLSIIIAVYNNGVYLRDRCIDSLKKSSIFNDMEIILVDDGSTDNETIEIIKLLQKEYSNIKAYFFQRGGSGSASRPRNKGINLATAPYVTYLDPDNKAINDGYYKLYRIIERNNFDIVLGNYEFIYKHSRKLANYYNTCIFNNINCNEIRNTRELLLKTKFSVDSIQAMIIKKELILNNNVIMEGVGEDTVFFYEIMLLANKIKVINQSIHLYYKDTKGSLTNNINNGYFEGHLLSQKRKKKVFDKFNILESYLITKHEYHFKHYLYNKINKAEDKVFAKKKLYEMYDVYENKWKVRDREMRMFFYNR